MMIIGRKGVVKSEGLLVGVVRETKLFGEEWMPGQVLAIYSSKGDDANRPRRASTT
jgi:hypothetical protein